jgi:GTPase SAR1 family protein
LSRKEDLAQFIRESYEMIHRYQEIIQTAIWPKAKLRARREIGEQWALIEGWLGEYHLLAGDDLSDDIAQISGRSQTWREDLDQLVAQATFASREEQTAYRNRQAMIQRVRDAWIAGVLEKSLYRVARIELGMAERPEAVTRPWDTVLRMPQGPDRPLAPGTPMIAVFEDMGEALLILGAPGAGKTTMLLDLARDLIDRAQRDAGQPIPVVLNLSSWTDERAWMVEELNTKYQIPKRIGGRWVAGDELAPLLDGLDEVRTELQGACVAAINDFRREHGTRPLTVCSRVKEFEALDTTLELQGAILLQPLTSEQVEAYLEKASDALLAVRETWQHDNALRELVETPLMLNVMALAYGGMSAQELGRYDTVEARRKHVFEKYLARMLERKGDSGVYAPEQTVRWLAWLAREMTEHGQTVFLIERMQPDWLATRWQRWLVTGGVAVLSGLVFGLVFGLVGRLVVGLFYRLFFGLVGVLFGELVGYSKVIEPVEMLRWSWRTARASLPDNLGLGLVFGLVVMLFVGLFGVLVGGLVFGLGVGLVFGLVVVLFGGLTVGEVTNRVSPNEGMHRSARNARGGVLVGVLVVGLGGGLGGMLVGVLFGMLGGGLGAGLGGVLVGVLVGGPASSTSCCVSCSGGTTIPLDLGNMSLFSTMRRSGSCCGRWAGGTFFCTACCRSGLQREGKQGAGGKR